MLYVRFITSLIFTFNTTEIRTIFSVTFRSTVRHHSSVNLDRSQRPVTSSS